MRSPGRSLVLLAASAVAALLMTGEPAAARTDQGGGRSVVEEVAQRPTPVVEEVAQRPSRDVVSRGWDGSSTVLRGFEARCARTSATVGRAVSTVAEVRGLMTGREAAFLDHRDARPSQRSLSR